MDVSGGARSLKWARTERQPRGLAEWVRGTDGRALREAGKGSEGR
jgi:hypothetical protein